MHKKIYLAASIFCLLGVLIGAFGAHSIKPKISAEQYGVVQTAVTYHFIHAMAMMMMGMFYRNYKSFNFVLAAVLFASGILCFSFSIYVNIYSIAITGDSMAGLMRITPIGGVLFVAGWAIVIYYFIKNGEKTVRDNVKSSSED